jgi:hypothetical protein
MNNEGGYEGSGRKGKTRRGARPCDACSRLFPACLTASLLRNLQQWDVRLRYGLPVTVAIETGTIDRERTGFWILDWAVRGLSVANKMQLLYKKRVFIGPCILVEHYCDSFKIIELKGYLILQIKGTCGSKSIVCLILTLF